MKNIAKKQSVLDIVEYSHVGEAAVHLISLEVHPFTPQFKSLHS